MITDWIAEAHTRPIVDLGQIPADQRRKLDRLVKKDELIKFRAYWNTMSPFFGLGPLKTWFVAPSLVNAEGNLISEAA